MGINSLACLNLPKSCWCWC